MKMIKILLVEDEDGIRTSIANAFSWNKLGCELYRTAASGLEALEICIQNPPDIVISDIVMPGIDGLTFVKYIKEKQPDMQFIILTGHRNFDYAKDALNLGAAYFMLKPVNYNELKAAIASLVSRITDTQEGRKLEIQKEQLLCGLLSGRLRPENLHETPLSSWFQRVSCYQVLTLAFDNGEEAADNVLRMENLSIFAGHMLKDYSCLFTKMDSGYFIIIFPYYQKEENMFAQKELFLLLQRKTADFFRTSASMGVSTLLTGFSQLHEGYIQSMRALGQKFFSGNSSLNFFLPTHSEGLCQITDYNLPSLSAQKTADLLKRSNGLLLEQLANDLFFELFSPYHQNIGLIKSSFIIVAILCIKKVVREDSRQLALILEKYGNFQMAVKAQTLQDLKDIFINLVLDLSEYQALKLSPKQTVIDKVIVFIEENYQTNISLNDIAKTVYLSPSYLSSMITRETGKSFTDILNEIRIQKAIELLKDPKRKIADVAYNVGFNEPQYFSIVFKKVTQLTPREYREMFLNEPRDI
ncbi:response regulator [Clostridium sp. AF19-22AC]|jgi:two-component system response regulator YesN|nr:response regulator [Clostridium sp. AF19-22AC]